MLEKISAIVFVCIMAILLILLLVLVPQGTALKFTYVDRLNESNLIVEKATCREYDGTFISNIELFEEFNDTCEIIVDSIYDSEYFKNKVLIAYFYEGALGNVPKSFSNDYFTVEDHEIITIRYTNSNEEEVVWRIYLIEMNQDDVSSADIHFE